jgi:hypothetical protein
VNELEKLQEALERVKAFAEHHDETRGTNVVQYVHLQRTSLYLITQDLNRVIALAEEGLAAQCGPPPRGGH